MDSKTWRQLRRLALSLDGVAERLGKPLDEGGGRGLASDLAELAAWAREIAGDAPSDGAPSLDPESVAGKPHADPLPAEAKLGAGRQAATAAEERRQEADRQATQAFLNTPSRHNK